MPQQININDIILCAAIIDAATQRGLFKAEELSNVAGLYDRLKGFIDDTPKDEAKPRVKYNPPVKIPSDRSTDRKKK